MVQTTISQQLERLLWDKAQIIESLENLGLADEDANLDEAAQILSEIQLCDDSNITFTQNGDAYVIPRGYHNGGKVVAVNIPTEAHELEEKTVAAGKTVQIIEPSEGYYGLSKVTVAALAEGLADVSQVTAQEENVLSTKIFVSANGTPTIGTMPDHGTIYLTINGLTEQSVNVPAGYTRGGTVNLTGDIESALAAI